MMIYKAPMEYYLAAVNHITTLSAVLFSVYAIKKLFEPKREYTHEKRQAPWFAPDKVIMLTTDYEEIYFAIGFVIINAILRITAYRYPLRIYKNGTK
jgi:hypothetical protein